MSHSGFNVTKFGMTPLAVKMLKDEYGKLAQREKAQMDQAKAAQDEGDDQDVFMGAVHAAALGTLLAIYESNDLDWPVPTRLITLPQKMIYFPPDSYVWEAWCDVDGNEENENYQQAVDLIHIPLYAPSRHEHVVINSCLIDQEDDLVNRFFRINQARLRTNHAVKRTNAALSIEKMLEAFEARGEQ